MMQDISFDPNGTFVSRYATVARTYDRAHARWLRACGAEAQAALESAVRARLRPGARLLDVGCGTGMFARRLLSELGSEVTVSIADPCAAMLEMCDDFPACRARAPLEDLPWADESQDVVTCAWAYEVAVDRQRAAQELFRVLAPGGLLALAFCARKPGESLAARLWRNRIESRGFGQFLDPEEVARAFACLPGCMVRPTPCNGPAAALLVTKEAS